MKDLRKLLWLYLVLLIFEGALRKWIIPALDAPLLVVRDPLVIWIYIVAAQQGYSFKSPFFKPTIVLAIFTALLSTAFGIGTIPITVYGLRTNFLQIPLIFLIPQILDREDVIRMGRFLLWALVPIALLAILQFKSPYDSLVNKGAYRTHYGTVRPSGPFSFIVGLVCYFSLVASFLFYGYLKRGTYKMWLLVPVTLMLLIASGVSGSRSCLVSVAIVAVVAVLCVIMRGKGGAGLLLAGGLIGLLLAVASSVDVFKEGTEQLTRRFSDASIAEGGSGGFFGRYFDTMLDHLALVGDSTLFGYGLGVGTKAGIGMLPGGANFQWPEDEWGRLIFESGTIFGVLLCVFRVALTFYILKFAYEAFRRDNVLPILIFAGVGLLELNGQWGVPTVLGFAIFGGGLVLAACIEPEDDEYDDEEDETDDAEEESDHPAEPGHVA